MCQTFPVASIVSIPPVRPRSLTGVLPDSLAAIGGVANPSGLPAVDHVVVVVVDGLGSRLLAARSGYARFLRSAPDRTISTVFPTTTAAALTSLTTGADPGQHGLVGYRMLDARHDRLVNGLTGWDAGMDPETWQRCRTVFEQAGEADVAAFAVGPATFVGSGFTRATLRGATYEPADSLRARFERADALTRSNGRSLTYLYVPELDKISHQHGWESDRWTAALEELDGEMRRFVAAVGRRVGVLLTADHGSLDVPHTSQVLFDQAPELVEGVRHVGGEPRCLHLYLEPGATASDRLALADVWRDSEGERAWVFSRDEAVDGGLFGEVHDDVLPRIGDVIVAARKRIAYYDSRPTDQAARRMIGQHGSLTDEERTVPFIRFGAFGQ